jgi:hypothetical protein
MNIGQKIGELRNDLGASDAHQDASQRGARRNRGAAITGGTAVLARAVQVSTSLITIPLTVHYLGMVMLPGAICVPRALKRRHGAPNRVTIATPVVED